MMGESAKQKNDDFISNVEKDEFVIATAADLYGFADIVSNGTTKDTVQLKDKHIYLVNDIVINKGTATVSDTSSKLTVTFSDTETVYTWNAIGGIGTGQFGGTFDGQMHTISGIYYDNSADAYNKDVNQIGLFGSLRNATIKNFKLVNSYFYMAAKNNAGSIAGRMYSGSMENVYSEAYIWTKGQINGGLLGASQTDAVSIKNCEFAGTIKGRHTSGGNHKNIGGILGYSAVSGDSIENCKFSGKLLLNASNNKYSYVGGLLGQALTGTGISNSLSSGTITLTSGKEHTIYGMIAGNSVSASDSTVSTLSCTNTYAVNSKANGNSYAVDASTTVPSGISMVVNAVDAGIGLGCYSEDEARDWVLTYDVEPSLKVFNDEYLNVPSTFATTDTDGKGILFTIKTADEMYTISDISLTGEDFADDTIVLANDIVMNEGDAKEWHSNSGAAMPDDVTFWIPIGGWEKEPIAAFKGTLDGQGYTISGVCMQKNETGDKLGMGFIRTLSGTVKNVRFENSFFYSQYSKLGTVAGIVDGGTIQNVYSDAFLRCSSGNAQRTGFGGIAGALEGEASTITNCHFAGMVNARNSASKGGNEVGGIVGYITSDSTITHCLFTGTNRGTGAYTGNIGGLVGYMSAGTMSYCLNAGKMHADVTNGYRTTIGAIIGGVGSTTTTVDEVEVTILPTVTNCYALEGTCTLTGDDEVTFTALVNGSATIDATAFASVSDVKLYEAADADTLIATGKWVAGTDYPVPTLAD